MSWERPTSFCNTVITNCMIISFNAFWHRTGAVLLVKLYLNFTTCNTFTTSNTLSQFFLHVVFSLNVNFRNYAYCLSFHFIPPSQQQHCLATTRNLVQSLLPGITAPAPVRCQKAERLHTIIQFSSEPKNNFLFEGFSFPCKQSD